MRKQLLNIRSIGLKINIVLFIIFIMLIFGVVYRLDTTFADFEEERQQQSFYEEANLTQLVLTNTLYRASSVASSTSRNIGIQALLLGRGTGNESVPSDRLGVGFHLASINLNDEMVVIPTDPLFASLTLQHPFVQQALADDTVVNPKSWTQNSDALF